MCKVALTIVAQCHRAFNAESTTCSERLILQPQISRKIRRNPEPTQTPEPQEAPFPDSTFLPNVNNTRKV